MSSQEGYTEFQMSKKRGGVEAVSRLNEGAHQATCLLVLLGTVLPMALAALGLPDTKGGNSLPP